ncbi:MAG: hypothetical protein U0521_15490 [Anaerolineae bacterium]
MNNVVENGTHPLPRPASDCDRLHPHADARDRADAANAAQPHADGDADRYARPNRDRHAHVHLYADRYPDGDADRHADAAAVVHALADDLRRHTPIRRPSPSDTYTPTFTPTDTYTPTPTDTDTPTPTFTRTPTRTYTPTKTSTPMPTYTPTLAGPQIVSFGASTTSLSPTRPSRWRGWRTPTALLEQLTPQGAVVQTIPVTPSGQYSALATTNSGRAIIYRLTAHAQQHRHEPDDSGQRHLPV